MQRFYLALLVTALSITTTGCGSGETAPQPTTSLKPLTPAAPVEEPAEPAAEPVMVQEEATVGVGAKGRDYEPGLVTTPVKAYFTAKEEIAFNIQIPNAMKFYKAQFESYPKSHEEFMEKIIKPNGIALPELPSGHHYVYNPETGQLMVEHPQ